MVGLQTTRKIPLALSDSLPHVLIDVPTVHQNMRMCFRQWLKAFYGLQRHLDFAPEDPLLSFADRFLDVHLRFERILAIFYQIDSLKQAVARHGVLMRAGVVPT